MLLVCGKHRSQVMLPVTHSWPAANIMMKRTFYTVAIGASAGGLPAILEFLREIPVGLNAAFVIICHLSRSRRSMLDQILPVHTRMPVVRVDKDMPIQTGLVYVIVENTYITSEQGWLKVWLRPDSLFNEAIDVFFSSVATDFDPKAIGVVLSGSGEDGTLGSGKIEAAGGRVMAQDPLTAEYGSMPGSVIEHDHPCAVMKPALLAANFMRLYNDKD